ncbi:MAG: DoxX family protein [Propionibacteriaceae bacterium]|jgi:putative oxidoreductase|nr:DoxX family protein [Propionibacteriaceae bacterium]
MKVFVSISQNVVLLLARLTLAVVAFVHGWVRLGGDGGIGVYADRLAAAGLPWPSVFAWGAAVLELGGAIFLAFGIGVRIIAAAFAAEFIMTILWLHWPVGFSVAAGGYEYAAVMAVLALVFVAFGGGSLSVDRLLFGRKRDNRRAGAV